VFDTTTVFSALVFRNGRLSWLREHWRGDNCVPLISHPTAMELTKVLGYPRFGLSSEERMDFLAEYLPYCKIIEANRRCAVVCRDVKDQPFLDLAQSGKAEVLVSGDRDLLVLAGRTSFSIVTPEEYRGELTFD
jgi:putative PIN family toxin of toxin-antitoxin system